MPSPTSMLQPRRQAVAAAANEMLQPGTRTTWSARWKLHLLKRLHLEGESESELMPSQLVSYRVSKGQTRSPRQQLRRRCSWDR